MIDKIKIYAILKYLAFLTVIVVTVFCEDPLQSRFLNSHDSKSPNYIPVEPSEMSVTVKNDSLFVVTWEDNSLGEDGFKLFLKSDDESEYSLIAVVGENVTIYNDTIRKTSNTLYNYKVNSFDKNTLSVKSAEATTSFIFPAPKNISVVGAESNSLVLSWESGIQFPTESIIKRRSNLYFEEIAIVPPGISYFIDKTVDKNNLYEYKISSRTTKIRSETSKIFKCGFQITSYENEQTIDLLLENVEKGFLSEDESTLLIVGTFGANLIEVKSGQILNSINFVKEVKIASNISLSKNKEYFAVCSWHDSLPYVYRINDGSLLSTISGDWPAVDVVIADDGSYVIASFGSGNIECWDISNNSLLWSIKIPSNKRWVEEKIASIWLLPNEHLLTGNNEIGYIINAQSGEIISSNRGGYFLKEPLVTEDGEILIAKENGDCINLSTNNIEFATPEFMNFVSISKDKLHIIAQIYSTYIVNTMTGTQVLIGGYQSGHRVFVKFIEKDSKFLMLNQFGQIKIINVNYNWDDY